jgi:hypothetical protein
MWANSTLDSGYMCASPGRQSSASRELPSVISEFKRARRQSFTLQNSSETEDDGGLGWAEGCLWIKKRRAIRCRMPKCGVGEGSEETPFRTYFQFVKNRKSLARGANDEALFIRMRPDRAYR